MATHAVNYHIVSECQLDRTVSIHTKPVHVLSAIPIQGTLMPQAKAIPRAEATPQRAVTPSRMYVHMTCVWTRVSRAINSGIEHFDAHNASMYIIEAE